MSKHLRSLIGPFFVSLVLHVLAVVTLLFGAKPKDKQTTHHAFEVELVQRSTALPSVSSSAHGPRAHRAVRLRTVHLRDLLKISPESFSAGDMPVPNGLLSSQGDEGVRGFSENIKLLPLLRVVHRQIEERLDFPEALLKEKSDSFFWVNFTLNEDGSLQQIWSERESPSAMQAWVMSKIREALNVPLRPRPHIAQGLKLKAEFHFERPVRGLQRPSTYEPIQGEVLVFSRAHFDDVLSATKRSLGAEPVAIISVDVLALFEKLFGHRDEDPKRVFWDLNYRLNEATHACEAGHAVGACYISGQIEEAFGHSEIAMRWYTLACEQGQDKACAEAARLKPRG